jgi:hypothetical protein
MPAKESKKEKAREVIDILQEISVLLVRLPLITSDSRTS